MTAIITPETTSPDAVEQRFSARLKPAPSVCMIMPSTLPLWKI